MASLHGPHHDTSRRVFSAIKVDAPHSQKNISPLTNFIFEFFIYNSLYAVDWETSIDKGAIHLHSRENGLTESKIQNAFETFCRHRIRRTEVDAENWTVQQDRDWRFGVEREFHG